MADSTTWLLLGVLAGAGLALGAVGVMQRRQQAQPADGVTAVEFRRDEQGRIAGFERVGVGAGGVLVDAPR